MREFIDHLTERNYQNRKIAFIENGSWAPMAIKAMTAMFAESKNITICDTKVTVKIAMTADTVAQLEKLADEILQ